MKKGLIICSTPYQVMVGIILRMQCFEKGDLVDFILTDTFAKYDQVASRIASLGICRNVYAVKMKHIMLPQNVLEKIRKMDYLLRFVSGTEKVMGTEIDEYDEMFFNCEEIFTYNMMSILRFKNKACKIYRYEEGYSSYSLEYSSSTKSEKLVNFRNRLVNKNLKIDLDGFFLFEPELAIHKYPYPLLCIDRNVVKNAEYRKCISDIFQTEQIAQTYNRKYIIFEESFFTDGFDIDDMELYTTLVNNIGPEKVSVKLHPRTVQNRFESLSVDIHEKEGVPWEAILLTKTFPHTTLFALASGSVINSRLLLGDSTTACLLYKCLKKCPPALDENFELFLEGFQRKYNNAVIVPADYLELQKLTEEMEA